MGSAIPPQGYYAASAHPAPARPRLGGDRKADICIVGAGYTGLSAALHLAAAGAKVVVLEAESVGFAASGRNGGQIHTGHRKDQAELERWLGEIHARALWDIAQDAKATVRGVIARHNIDCALKDGLVIAAHSEAAAKDLAEDTDHLSGKYGYAQARMMDAAETARALGTAIYPAARMDNGGGHLHPLDFARGLAAAAERAGAQVFEHSRVLAFDEDKAGANLRTADGLVTAEHVLLATDAFSGALAPELAGYIGHLESFIVATAPLDDALYDDVLPCDAAVADTRHVLDYYRKSADRRMLFAGRESYWSVPKDVAALVRPRMAHVFPKLADVAIEYAWHGTVGITATRMPHFGRLGKRALFAYGYSGQGVALATGGGKLMAEAVLGNPERFDAMARVPPTAFPGGQLLRKPLVAAALFWFKLMDGLG
ncbi:MAG: FAD-binding oxidoreductase [Alphaproteobacteria bacterium]|nr:FAD-binding oxidoreductase [Alphaproteobacteria bacterium]